VQLHRWDGEFLSCQSIRSHIWISLTSPLPNSSRRSTRAVNARRITMLPPHRWDTHVYPALVPLERSAAEQSSMAEARRRVGRVSDRRAQDHWYFTARLQRKLLFRHSDQLTDPDYG
jgi:hypothetical protein